MRTTSRRLIPNLGRRTAGFSLLEVLIALLVLAFGLLGFALLQTMNLRFTQSANYRTQATNLAYELLDQIRANRLVANDYTKITTASFAGMKAAHCPQLLGEVKIDDNMARWRCEVIRNLGEGATAVVLVAADNEVTVTIEWNDQRWVAADTTTDFTVSTRL